MAGRCTSAARRAGVAEARTTRPSSVRARDRRPGAPSPTPGTTRRRARKVGPGGGAARPAGVAPAGAARAGRAAVAARSPSRRRAAVRPSRSSGRRPDCRCGCSTRGPGRPARRPGSRRGGLPGRRRVRVAVALLVRVRRRRRIPAVGVVVRVGLGLLAGALHGVVERLLVDARLVERVAAATVRQREAGRDPHVLLRDRVRPPPRGVRGRGAGDDEVGAHAVDVERGAHRGDAAQLGVGQRPRRRPGPARRRCARPSRVRRAPRWR